MLQPDGPRKLPRLLQLVQQNADKPKRFEVRADAGGQSTTIYLYDAIDQYWGINALDFIKELNAIATPSINLRINSPGGDVFDARAIATALRGHPSDITASIDGLAASAASYVAIACDQVEMADGAFMMIHKAWSLAFGNSDDLLQLAALLEKIDQSICSDFAAKTGIDKPAIMGMMAAETWMTAQEALDNGFIDRVAGDSSASNQWNLAAYDHAPQSLTERHEPADPRAHLERRLALLQKIAA